MERLVGAWQKPSKAGRDDVRQVAFFSVASHEREALENAAIPESEIALYPEELDASSVSRAAGAEVVSVSIYSKVDASILSRLPNLRLVATRSTGFDHIDVEACRQRGIAVAHVPSYGENTVAEHAFGLILLLARKLQLAVARTRNLDFSLAGLQGSDLKGKVLGVVGAGRIGREAIRIGRGFGMTVLAHDRFEQPEIAAREGFRYVPLAELLGKSDVVTIHLALTAETHHLIGRRELMAMKPGALVINTARGAIIDTEALCEALHKGWIAGAGLDVLEAEDLLKFEDRLMHGPLTDTQVRQIAFGHVLLRHPNVVLTPHSAFFTREGVDRLIQNSLDNIRAFLGGRPQNLVSGTSAGAAPAFTSAEPPSKADDDRGGGCAPTTPEADDPALT